MKIKLMLKSKYKCLKINVRAIFTMCVSLVYIFEIKTFRTGVYKCKSNKKHHVVKSIDLISYITISKWFRFTHFSC